MKYLIFLFIFSCGKELEKKEPCPTCVKLWVYDVGQIDTMIKPTVFCDPLPTWLVGDTGQRYNSPTVGSWKVVLKCK